MNNIPFYLHVGLPRTGTTFLQNSIFNNINDINFTLKPDLNNFKIKNNQINLISDEGLLGNVWGNNRFISVEKIYKEYPEAKIIIGFRKHHKWVQSMYSLYLKRGGSLKVNEFLDLEFNNGVLDKKQLDFSSLLKEIKNKFKYKPFVYFLEEIESKDNRLVSDLSNYLGIDIDSKKFNYTVKNKGLNSMQKELCRRINSFFISNYNKNGYVKLSMINKFNLYPIKFSSLFYNNCNSKTSNRDKIFYDKIKKIYKNDWDSLLSSVSKIRK
tara:strand:+ start:4176 stop:4982 length:807 start_codon:yes stop_codon:yes gene_type:complete